jgi:hypothetical protein
MLILSLLLIMTFRPSKNLIQGYSAYVSIPQYVCYLIQAYIERDWCELGHHRTMSLRRQLWSHILQTGPEWEDPELLWVTIRYK